VQFVCFFPFPEALGALSGPEVGALFTHEQGSDEARTRIQGLESHKNKGRNTFLFIQPKPFLPKRVPMCVSIEQRPFNFQEGDEPPGHR
jgi:hypothetical protein